jgi:hypothetical protein
MLWTKNSADAKIIKIFLCLCCTVIFLQTNAQDTERKKYFQGYSGGMMFHTGYLSAGSVDISDSQKQKIEGMAWGIGGLVRFHFGQHFRIGGEGYNSTLYYGKNKSYTTLSWGGLLMDCQWIIHDFTLFLGGTIGGGNVKNITILNNTSSHSTNENALYRKYTVMIADPFLGMEYAMTQRIHLIIKADCIFNIMGKQSDFATGVRIYTGVVFFHARKSK